MGLEGCMRLCEKGDDGVFVPIMNDIGKQVGIESTRPSSLKNIPSLHLNSVGATAVFDRDSGDLVEGCFLQNSHSQMRVCCGDGARVNA